MKEREKTIENNQIANHNPSPRTISGWYARWFDDRINEFIDDHKTRFETRSMFKRRNGFFITISFDQNRLKDPTTGTELDAFSDIYNRVCREVIDRNYHRSGFKGDLPLAIAAIDCNGTRHWHSMGEIENIHIHSIWILTDKSRERFERLWNDQDWIDRIRDRHGIRAIDIERIDDDRTTSDGYSVVSSYTSKFIGHNQRELAVGDDFRVFR